MDGKASESNARTETKVRKVFLISAVSVAVLLPLLLGLAIALFDIFGHDLLCRYGQTRWDPVERDCYVPLANDALRVRRGQP